uniref:Uncharacterized protein n=1 Tax=Wuchereria bancrofti TaxID=6293 RepID=A0A1I8ECS1_WUCBA
MANVRKIWSTSKHYVIQSEAHDINLRSISQASLPTSLFPNLSSTTALRNVKSLSGPGKEVDVEA